MHKSLILLLVVLLVCVGITAAQEDNWKSDTGGTIEYNCDLMDSIQSALDAGSLDASGDFNDTPFARFKSGTELTFAQFVSSSVLSTWSKDANTGVVLNDVFSDVQATCDDITSATAVSGDTFSVKATGNINLRSCAGTNCDIVGTVSSGTLLTILNTDEDWFQVQYESGTAYVASWLTVRGPDDIITSDQPYLDPRTACIVAFDKKRGDMDMNIILSGSERDRVLVDLYRPNESKPLRVEGQLDKTFIDTGDPYVYQYYSWNVGWPNGLYQIEIRLGDKSSILGWELEERGEYNIFVHCE